MATHTDPLPSWTDGATKDRIVESVRALADEIPVERRIATFDNDGTLWCEAPMPAQLDFILKRMAAMTERDPSLLEHEPWTGAAKGDPTFLVGAINKHYAGDDSELQVAAGGILGAFAGYTVEDYEAASTAFLASAMHPTLGRPYTACVYRPMVELLQLLEANEFRTYIVSGGGRDFMRAIPSDIYGVPRHRLVGSTSALEYREDDTGSSVVHAAKLSIIDDGPEKAVQIWSHVGARPVIAGGNSNGDAEMLAFVDPSVASALRMLVRHDDADREFAYVTGAERAFETASQRGWLVVSMKDDWNQVFADASGS
jgi:hypothetical protein